MGDCKDAFIKSRTVMKLVKYGATIDDDSEITKRFNEILLKKLRILTEEQTMHSAANQLS